MHIYISRVQTSHFSYVESCIFVSIAPIDSKLSTRFYDDGCVFMNIRYFFFIFSPLPYLLLISSICIPRSVFVFSSSFFFLSSFPLSVAPFLSLFLYFYLSLSLRLSLSFLAVNCVYLPTRVSQYFLVRESETNDGPQTTIKILMFYFFLFYRLSQSTKLHPRVLITSIAKTQRGKFSRVSSLLACTPTWCMP